MNFHLITLFPESFDSYVSSSIIGRAVRNGEIKIKFYNPRDFTKDKHKRVDQKPYGGGPGMVLEAESVIKAIEKARGKKKPLIIWLSPSGKQFTNETAEKISKKYTDVILICGRYEGIDARVDKILKTKKVSVGDYVLTGGEIPAMILIDSISRQVEGVLGNFDSREEERISSSEVYTRPEILIYKVKKYKVPKVLLSGDHKKIEEWKKSK